MRTTLTLDDDVSRALKERMVQRGDDFKTVVNEALRMGLRQGGKPMARLPRFRVDAHHCGFRGGIDLGRLNQINDALEIAEKRPGPANRANEE
jgi:hypothetical protein